MMVNLKVHTFLSKQTELVVKMETQPLLDKNSDKNCNGLLENRHKYKSFNSTNKESAQPIGLEWSQVF